MTTLPETVQEYSRRAAQSFIQTAVFVDDRIYERGTVKEDEVKAPISVKTRKKVTKSANSSNKQSIVVSSDVDDEGNAPDTYDIVNSFAKKQIVCSLYQPKKSAQVSPKSDIFPLCKASDVVIVDWDLFGDKGGRALELISGLISQAVKDVPEQLRLILVYTQEVNLFSVADQIYEKVYPSIGESFQPCENQGGLAFHTENSRIVVLGKPGRERPDTDPSHIVEESHLADIAVREFAKLASGILHAATLMGLAEIRKNSRKVLSRFSSDLDPAFLTHLAMCLPDDDASTHMIPLLVSEIEAVLEDALPTPLLPEKILRDWCLNVWQPGAHLDQLLGKKGLNHREIAEAICTKGFKEAATAHDTIPKMDSDKDKTKRVRKASKILLPSDGSDANHRFSHLMASRTFYGDGKKILKMGSIVHQKDDDLYLLCIQPVCDSVRLKKPRVFMFVQMSKGASGAGSSASHVIVEQGNSILELIYQPKSYLCLAAEFAPDAVSQRIAAKQEEDGSLFFEDTGWKKYHWLDQLRTSHAQRAVERFASDLSRVGLTESEWLRRLESK
ncbi:response regulator receiver domain [Thalassospira sp. GO-4]|jgi:hypothetical protein|uniref:response regulator receiver domain n=1 Tax=Thalassospira sp. GO-4 TaxID=2946605 RepID=UPI00202456A1|nr:response regulator receiver domain [Thalassospira sp. GO-4]URK16319.1 response regulator receiver domain [Thalassospira sp. GO-4]